MNEHPLREDIFKILRLLSDREDLSQRDLSGHLGMSLGKTNYLLKGMIKRGLIMVRNFTVRDNKIKKVKYILTKEGFDVKLQWAYYYLKRKEEEYLELKKEFENISDGANVNAPENFSQNDQRMQ
ncbi:MAG: MarR family EPS-associated transcriptional regulator [Candidatus Omnitrophota bacterium]